MITKKLVIDYHYACTSGKGIAVQFLLSLLADCLFKRLVYKMLTVLCVASLGRDFFFFFYSDGERGEAKEGGKQKKGRSSAQKLKSLKREMCHCHNKQSM